MESLKSLLVDEIKSFRELGHKFAQGEISRAEFKGISGGMGVYSHRNGKELMVRLRIPSGVLSKDELNLAYDYAIKNNLEVIHLTTRQAIQLHGLTIDNVCDIMLDGLEKGMYTRGSGGNFPRNVAISPLSGVDSEDVFDVTPYALEVNKFFMSKINTYKLPRKLKVAFASNEKDHSHCTAVDQGFIAVKENDKEYFKLYIGGGMGRNSMVGVEFDELVNPEDVLYHVEAITNLFIAEGNYENKAKARIRYILDRMGKEEFINCYKNHLAQVMSKEGNNLKLNIEYTSIDKVGEKIDVVHPRLVSQKQDGLYSVYFHPIGGQLSLDLLKEILDFTNNLESVDFRLSMTEGIYIRNLNGSEAKKVIELTSGKGGETRLEQSVACIGVPTCQMGAVAGQDTLNEIVNLFRKEGISNDILPSVHISGCANSCGVHAIGEIGFAGKMKRVVDQTKPAFEFYVGGEIGVGKTKLAQYKGDILQESVPGFLLELAKEVANDNMEFKQWIQVNEDKFQELISKYLV